VSIAGIAASSFSQARLRRARRPSSNRLSRNFKQLGQESASRESRAGAGGFGGTAEDFPGAQGAIPGAAQKDSVAAGRGFQQLSNDLHTGNLAAAQADFANLRQDLPQGHGPAIRPHRHPRHGEDATANPNGIAQVLSQLGQAFQSSTSRAAQQSYATLVQQFQQAAAGSALDGGVAPASGPVSLSA